MMLKLRESEMNTALQVKHQQITGNTYFKCAVTHAEIICDTDGICNLAAIPGKAVDNIKESHLLVQGNKFYETELCKNLEFASEIFDRAMNCLDINEDVANRHIRIAQTKKMIKALHELLERL